MLQVGACAGETAWGFPIRQPELLLPAKAILEGWNPVHNGHGADALLAHVVRQIRTWRPSVILIPADRGCDGLPQIVQQTVVAAVKLAGDPMFLADQFGPAGCQPWNVERVYLVSATFSPLPPAVPGRMGETQGVRALGKIALAANDWSSGLGQTWADAALLARASWTTIIKRGRPWSVCNSSRAGQLRLGRSRRQPLVRGSANPRIVSTSCRELHRSTVLHAGRWRKPATRSADRWTALPRGGRCRPSSSISNKIPRRCSPGWPKATSCRRASTLRRPPR